MDNIIFGVAIVLAFILPIYYFIASKSKETKAVKTSLHNFLSPLGLSVGEMDILGSKIIGLDNNKSHLYFYQVEKTQVPPVVLPLENFSSCRVQSSANGSGPIQKVELIFEPKSKTGVAHHIPVFDMYKDMQLQGELQLAEKWKNIVNNLFNK